MALVTERMNANRPATPVNDPRSGRLTPSQVNAGRDLDVNPPQEDKRFFGSFFNSKKQAPKRQSILGGGGADSVTGCRVLSVEHLADAFILV